MAACPSCGRDPGPNDVCPHCGADLKRRLRIRTLGLIAIGLAILGVVMLWFFATRAPVARVSIAELQATSNYAYVQIDGVVSRVPNYNATAQSLTFWVRDVSGELLVSAYRATVADLIAAERVPMPGDTVVVQGTVRVRDSVAGLTLDSVKSLALTRVTDSAPLRDIGSVTVDDALHAATVQGVVRSIRAPFDGLQLITLRDATGAIDLAVSTELAPVIGALPPIAVDQSLQVIGTVTRFDTSPQLTLRRAADITPLTERVAFAKFTPLAELSESLASRWVRVEGTVEEVAPFSAGVKLTLSDGGERATILVWQDLWNSLNAAQPIEPGATLSVQGEVSVYRGQLEITPEVAQDVALLQPAAPVAVVSNLKPLGSITAQDLNTLVTTRGTIGNIDPINRGMRYELSDQDQSIVLLIWDDVIAKEQRQQLVTGAVISVTGKIESFGGQLEIVPEASDQVVMVTAPAIAPTAEPSASPTLVAVTSTPTPEPTITKEPTSTSQPAASAPSVSINAITADYVGKDVAVRAKIVETASFSAGFKFLVDDGTGRMWLTLFSDNYRFVSNRAGLNLGADISIVAEVAQFQGVLELQPHAGRDVTINTPGSNASVPLVSVNQLSKPGQLVAIEGRITEVKGFSSGQYLQVDDGTGNVRVTLFNNVLAFVPNKDGLVVGAQVRVVGKTEFFGRIQVSPALGYDVTLK
ncbi:MAG: OB-fold nucleic acid binding domain-containing protein [Anaerolineae bacterium]